MLHRIALAAAVVTVPGASAAQPNFETISGMSCGAYLRDYGQWSRENVTSRQTAYEQRLNAISDYVGQRVENMNRPNVLDSIACECKLQGHQTVEEAVTKVIGANKLGLVPVTPLGGTATRDEQRWRNAFARWIRQEGRLPPRLKGRLACDYIR